MLKELRELGGDITVLYVEDEDATRERVAKTLSTIFGKVLVADNGRAGLELYESKKPDLIISDIQMPRMNGLEMSRVIKSIDRRAPIVVTTAFNDEKYLIDAIEIGIDRYVLKPIEMDKFVAVLTDTTKALVERRRSDELKKQELAKKINTETSKVLLEAINLYPSPTVIYSYNGKVSAVNNAFVDLAGKDRLERILDGSNLSDLFTVHVGFLSDLASLDPEDKNRNKVLIKTANGSKVFLADSQILATSSEFPSIVYTLTDITRLEYERLKAQNLSMYLRDLNKIRKSGEKLVATPENRSAAAEGRSFTDEEREKLAKSHIQKTTAEEYTKEIAGDVLDELDELSEIENEMANHIDNFEESKSTGDLGLIAERIDRYALTVEKLFEFEDLAFALGKLAQFLPSLDLATINIRKLTLLLNSIRMDLASWRQMIFVSKEAKDIHYLDSSLLSSCLQIEIDFGTTKAEDDDDNELDLF